MIFDIYINIYIHIYIYIILYYMVSITSSRDIVANTLSVIDQDKVIDLKNMFDQNYMRLITF